MNNKGRWIRIIVISTVIAVALGAGLTASRVFFVPGAEELLKKGEAAYSKGSDALSHGDPATASVRFEEANLQANKSLDAVSKEKQKASEQAAERLEQVEGNILWLKMRALRDLFVAKGMVEGHPLPQAIDSITGAKFYSVLAIPEDQARQEAFASLREAARRLNRDAEVQRQVLLTELMLPVPDWKVIENTSRQALQLNAEDPWALYLLARIEFEQLPSTGRRSRSRVVQARQYIKQLKDSGNYPLWRTLYLEAQIAQWFLDSAAQSNADRRDTEEQTLRSLLFAPKGAIARAAAGEGLEHPGKWDIEGILGLHQIALAMAVEDSRQPRTTTAKVVELLNATLSLCRKLTEREAAYTPICALSASEALAKAEPALLGATPPDWKQDLDLVQELARKARDQKVVNPLLYETIAGLLYREAFIEGKRGNKERKEELNKQAFQWFEDGLRLAQEAKVPAEQLVGLNAGAAELLTLAGAKQEKIRSYLNALKESKSSRARSLASLLEASIAEREGRLVQARKLLEQVLNSGEPDFVIRAHMVLGGVYLDLGQPDKALVSLQQVVQAYKVYDQLTPQEKSWALEFIHGSEDLALLMVHAHVDSALMQLRTAAQRNPGKPVSLDMAHRHESAIAELRKRLQKETPQDRQARQIMAAYFSATQRRDLAERELAELRSYYPNSIDVLRTEVDLSPSAREAEKRIEQFNKDHPADLDARFFKVEWLIRMKRVEDALSYLQSPTNFDDTKSERYQRVLAAILLTKGDREGSQKILEHLPHDASTDALLIQSASVDDREKLLRQALARHEDSAQLQSWQAVLAFNKGDYPAAAEAFLRAGQYRRYEATARRGLVQSFLALAQKDPLQARDLAERMHKEAPDEPSLLLASAYVDLLLDQIGSPGDKPDPTKSMGSALNAWEQMVSEQRPQEQTSAPLTKSVFWGMAGRQDLALAEAVRALNMNPNDAAALGQTINLALESRDPELRSVTRKRLDSLRKLLPDNNNVLLLEARFDEWNEQPKDAIAICQGLLAKDAKLSEAYARLIPLLTKQGDSDTAWRYVRRWRKELPENIAAAQTEVRLLAEEKKTTQARKLAESMVRSLTARSNGGDEQAGFNLQLQMISALAQGKAWNEAEDWLSQLLAKDPDNVAILLRMADVYLAQLSWDKARAIYEKMLAKHKNAAAANNLAWLLAKHFNDAAQALRLAQEARKGPFSHKPISADRLRPEFLDTLGIIYTKLGNGSLYPEMRDLFEVARQRYPYDPRNYMYLAHAYAGLQEAGRAERLYEMALDVASKSGRGFLTSKQCDEVIAEVKAAQKKLKDTVQR